MSKTTREQEYQADYYQRVTKNKRRGRWSTDTDYRESEQRRARRRRALRRARVADVRFGEMIQTKKDQTHARMVERAMSYSCPTCATEVGEPCKGLGGGLHPSRHRHPPTQVPRDVWIDGHPVRCYSSGSLAREIGRESKTIRSWLRQRVLPGATAFFDVVDTRPDAYFSEAFCTAVKKACRRLYRLDSRFPRSKLRGLILEELARAKESYIPVGGSDADHVWPHKGGV